MRGGDSTDLSTGCRASLRRIVTPTAAGSDSLFGFRVARNP
jgi:formylglycine-generating enzyme required for sulfatase activity